MANPITWRTVTGPNTADAARPLYMAQQSFNGAFDALNKALSQRNEAVQQEQEKTKKNNFESFMSHMSQFSTPEEFQQAVQSGSLNQMAEGFGPDGIDRAAVRAAMDARPGILMDQAQQANEFSDYNMTRKQRGTRDNIMNQLYKGDIEGAQAQLAANPDMFNSAEIQKQISEFQRQQVLEGRDDKRFDWDGENHKWGIAAKEAATNASRQSARASAQAMGFAADNQAQVVKDREESELLDNIMRGRMTAFDAAQEEANTGLRSLRFTMNLPDRGDGLPDMDAMTPEQMVEFQRNVETAGLDKVPSPTQMREQFRREALEQGISAKGITAGEAFLDQSLHGSTRLSADEQARETAALANIDKIEDEANANNLFYIKPGERNQAKIDVLGKVDTLITDGPMTRTALRKKLSTWMDTGMEMKDTDGSTVLVRIPPKVIDAALVAGVEDSTWFVNSTDNRMEAIITNLMTADEFKVMRDDAATLDSGMPDHLRQEVREKLRIRSGAETPSDYLSTFNRRLKSLSEAAKRSQPVIRPPVPGADRFQNAVP